MPAHPQPLLPPWQPEPPPPARRGVSGRAPRWSSRSSPRSRPHRLRPTPSGVWPPPSWVCCSSAQACSWRWPPTSPSCQQRRSPGCPTPRTWTATWCLLAWRTGTPPPTSRRPCRCSRGCWLCRWPMRRGTASPPPSRGSSSDPRSSSPTARSAPSGPSHPSHPSSRIGLSCGTWRLRVLWPGRSRPWPCWPSGSCRAREEMWLRSTPRQWWMPPLRSHRSSSQFPRACSR